MARHGSASSRKLESLAGTQPHSTQPNFPAPGPQFQTSNTRTFQIKSEVITPDLKRRARLLAVHGKVDHGTRGLIRYALENNDPYLVQLVTRVEAGERCIDHLILDTD